MDDDKPIQLERVKALLRRHRSPYGVCSWLIYKGDQWGPLPNGRNSISELVRWHGWKIRADDSAHTTCGSAKPAHAHYHVEFDADTERQLPLLAGV